MSFLTPTYALCLPSFGRNENSGGGSSTGRKSRALSKGCAQIPPCSVLPFSRERGGDAGWWHRPGTPAGLGSARFSSRAGAH